jgi:hypothetical protein
MSAVAEHGGRIKPRVAVVKSLASALCIGAGGSVGRPTAQLRRGRGGAHRPRGPARPRREPSLGRAALPGHPQRPIVQATQRSRHLAV